MATCKTLLFMLGLLGLCSCTAFIKDPYYKGNLNGQDPRAVPLKARKPNEATPTNDQIVTAFKNLHRPIIDRYIEYQPKSAFVVLIGLDFMDYRIVLTDEACAFIRTYTFDELVLAIGPLLNDPYWSGDAVAVVAVASSPWDATIWLQTAKYRSPEQPGSWALDREPRLKEISFGREDSRYYINNGRVWDNRRNAPATQPESSK